MNEREMDVVVDALFLYDKNVCILKEKKFLENFYLQKSFSC